MWMRKVVWSPVELDYLKAHKSEPAYQLTIALAKSKNAVHNKILELDGKLPLSSIKKNRISKIGKRKDLNMFFRSGWEANVARWFVHEKATYFYEPRSFVFDGVKHGTVSYVPDFLITRSGSPVLPEENIWIEVKGMLKRQDKTRIKRFKKHFPLEFSQLRYVAGAPNTAADKFFKEMEVPLLAYYRDLNKKYKSVIPNWE